MKISNMGGLGEQIVGANYSMQEFREGGRKKVSERGAKSEN